MRHVGFMSRCVQWSLIEGQGEAYVACGSDRLSDHNDRNSICHILSTRQLTHTYIAHTMVPLKTQDAGIVHPWLT